MLLTSGLIFAILEVRKMTTGMKDEKGSQKIEFRAAITANSSGVKVAETRYYPWGTERYTYGSTLA